LYICGTWSLLSRQGSYVEGVAALAAGDFRTSLRGPTALKRLVMVTGQALEQGAP
jgi:hypothetical protein